jgi:tetratricopeptide (TPR) repeat protein
LFDSTSNPTPFDRPSEVYRGLVAAIANGALLFVGAGSSCRVGYPGWAELLRRLSEAARHANPDRTDEVDRVQDTDGLLQADTYRDVLGKAGYYDELRSAFGPRTPQHDLFHKMLVGLPFKHVLTTNYDRVLESAHAQVSNNAADSFDVDQWPQLSEFLQGHTTPGHGRRYVHVHGSIGRPEGIVLCQTDYDARYMNDTRARAFLQQIFTGQRVVFVGFSLADEDLNYILREVAGLLGLTDPRHFVLLPRPSTSDAERVEQTDLTRKYHVEPVYFENRPGDYSSLATLIATLVEDVQAEREREAAQNRCVPIEAVPRVLEDMLQDLPPELRDALNQRLPGVLERHAVPMPLQDTGSGGMSNVDSAIDAVFKLVEKGLPDDAIREYEAIRAKHEPTLTAKQRYRIDANIGNALYSKGQMEAAADAYLRAVGHYRDSRAAQALEILGHLLRGDTSETLRLAESLCEREPSFGRPRSSWVRAQPDSATFAQIEPRVPENLRADAEVALALSDLARRTGDVVAQERCARGAVAAAPDWVDALSTLGAAILTSEKDAASFDVDRGPVAQSSERVAEAEKLITQAIKLTAATDPAGQLAGLHFNRSFARQLLGDDAGSKSDLREAFRRDPFEPGITLAYATGVETPADASAALQSMDARPSEMPERYELQFARAYLRLCRRETGDLERALAEVDELSRRLPEVAPTTVRSGIVRLGLQLLSELGRASDGVAFVSGLPAEVLSPLALAVLQGRAELLAGGRDKAAEHAREAIRLLCDDSDWFDRRNAALLAQNSGLYSEAVRVWESILGAESTGSDTVHLVRCAYFAGDWKKALDVCGRARASGRYRREHLETEVDILARSREVDRALSLLQEWIRGNPKDKHIRLHLSFLSLQHGRRDLATFDESQLPSVAEVIHAEEAAALVNVLRYGPAPERALDAAYELYRRFPEHIAAHRMFIACVFDPSLPELRIERPTVVARNTAVRIQRKGGAPRWIHPEDGPVPAITRNEYPESHPLVIAMLGKRAGDHFEFHGHDYEVVEVENRALRRVHEIIERFEENFPNGPLLRLVKMPANPPVDAPVEEILGNEMMTELRRQGEPRELLESMYRANLLPLTRFAKLVGRPVFEVVRYLAYQPDEGVRADSGDAPQWPADIARLREKTDIVLDATALAGGLVLGLLDNLPRLGLNFVVPRAVHDEIRELSLNATSPRAPRGVLGLYQGKPFFHETSPEELAGEVEILERVLRFIRDHCEVAGGEATLDLPADLRKKMQAMLGESATDAVALTKKRNGVLWTDDLGLQVLASQPPLGVRSVWTQAVLSTARGSGRISAAEYTLYVGRLIERGYAFTHLTARDFTDLLRSTGWRADTPLGEAVIRNAKDVALLNPRNTLIMALAFVFIWRECPRRLLARDLIAAILEGIGRERSGPRLAALIYRGHVLPRLGIPRIYTLERMLRSWRSRDGEFRPKLRRACSTSRKK